MKRFLTILFVLAFASSAYAGEFGWTLSFSSTDPLVHTATPAVGFVNVYLWYQCTNDLNGLSAAEFAVLDGGAGALTWTFTPMSGFLNIGTYPDLLLAVGGCPMVATVAGLVQFVDFGGVGVDVCFQPSVLSSKNVSVNCGPLVEFPNDYVGCASNGATPCVSPEDLCETVSVEGSSWGAVKSLYR
jgi:hypothetical protein